MAETILKNVKVFVDGYNLSGDMNQVTVNAGQDIVDSTVFGSSARKRKGGLLNTEMSGSGFWNATTDSNTVDPVIFDRIAGSEYPVTVIRDGTGLGEIAYFSKALLADYSPSGNIGEMFGFTFGAQGNHALVRGQTLEWGSFSSDLSPTGRELGTRSSTQKFHAALIVTAFSSSGASATVNVLADTTADMAGTPSTTLSFSINESSDLNKAAFSSTTPASTDDDAFRVEVTMGTTDDSFTGLLVAGNF